MSFQGTALTPTPPNLIRSDNGRNLKNKSDSYYSSLSPTTTETWYNHSNTSATLSTKSLGPIWSNGRSPSSPNLKSSSSNYFNPASFDCRTQSATWFLRPTIAAWPRSGAQRAIRRHRSRVPRWLFEGPERLSAQLCRLRSWALRSCSFSRALWNVLIIGNLYKIHYKYRSSILWINAVE